jgi:hypothetical protein
MDQRDSQARFLLAHLDSLPESHRAVAEFVAMNWPLSKRLPKSVAAQASSLLGFRINSIESSRRVLGELFLLASKSYRSPGHLP